MLLKIVVALIAYYERLLLNIIYCLILFLPLLFVLRKLSFYLSLPPLSLSPLSLSLSPLSPSLCLSLSLSQPTLSFSLSLSLSLFIPQDSCANFVFYSRASLPLPPLPPLPPPVLPLTPAPAPPRPLPPKMNPGNYDVPKTVAIFSPLRVNYVSLASLSLSLSLNKFRRYTLLHLRSPLSITLTFLFPSFLSSHLSLLLSFYNSHISLSFFPLLTLILASLFL
ncbi:unnamed protein product [Acanthosepion pharaonis]|uniref:Uncharacterized protein n=1 Tax=Acanthosepion pharaonis TaxID=158019 RepID=A0A812EQ40_ACAPH|nr:unnamed protein product [Sepia pharaonis]